MASNKFKFVSPGVFINEIDQSQIARLPEDIGPVVIGRAVKGPMMRPIKVDNYTQFEELFGAPVPGSTNGDVWREGNKLAPTYGAYAAEAYLRNSGPLTFVRLGGAQHEDADVAGYAGWEVPAPTNTSQAANGGAYGLFVAPTAKANKIQFKDAELVEDSNNVIVRLSTDGVTLVDFDADQAVLDSQFVGAIVSFVKDGVNKLEGLATIVSITRNSTYFEKAVIVLTKKANSSLTLTNSDADTDANAYKLDSAGTSTVVTGDAKLAAILYSAGDTPKLYGTDLSTTSDIDAAGRWIKSVNDTTFKIKTDGKLKTINFDPSSKLFIRNVLNTNPTKLNDQLTDNTLKTFLGPSYENEITANGDHAGIILALAKGTLHGGKYKKSAEEASTGWIFGQHKGVASEWTPDANGEYPVQKLFKLVTLSEDEWTQKNIKVSIQNVKLPANQYVKFGTFSVIIRDINDTDDQMVVLERYDQCSIDPSSPNYIAKQIGDKYTVWDYNDKRYEEYGVYDNVSRYVRVEVDPDVAAGTVDQDLVPFGFYGPKKYKDVVVSAMPETAAVIIGNNSFLSTAFYGAASQDGLLSAVAVNTTLKFPSLPTVAGTNSYYLTRPDSIFWGVKTTKNDTKQYNKAISDYLLTHPAGITDETDFLEYSFVFSLDDIAATLSNGRYKTASWAQGNRLAGLSETSDNSVELNAFLDTFNKFTLPLVGGFEGLNIKEKEPFSNRAGVVDSAEDVLTSYAMNSLNVAIESVADPETVEMNALVVPGIKAQAIHKKMITVCENRGDSIAIIDIPHAYDSAFESKESEADRKPNVANATGYINSELITNSSYGAAFFPWVMTADNRTGNKVWIPSSIVALGTFGSTKRFSEVWFAPAGFTRGGLSENQAGGIPVLQVAQKLNSKERDALYEANINPIASFPSEGIVIFGQKTLQITPSALDRINVRRLMNYLKKEISRISATTLFDQNVEVTWNIFKAKVDSFLGEVKSGLGITEFKVVLDSTTTTPELIDRNILYAKIFLKPARSIEYIALDFTITNSGASFAD